MYGRTHTKEARLKMSKAQVGKHDNRGVKNPNAKLNEKQVRIIKWLCNNSSMLQREIAIIFNVTPSLVCHINNNKGWK